MTQAAVTDAGSWAPDEARMRAREGLAAPTTGWSMGFLQTNLVVVPAEWAPDFRAFAQANPQACPVVDESPAGQPTTRLAPGADLRTDLPRYRVWQDGRIVDEPGDVRSWWRDDLVSFHLGCSFTFEDALLAAGVPVRHLEQGRNVPMYVTTRDCVPAGRMHGPLVVSMRYLPPALVELATAVTSALPGAHGGPVHTGAPEELLNSSLDQPDYGDRVEPQPGDVPVFWACGVTPQAALVASGVPFAITHAPGHMLVTDQRAEAVRRP